MVEESLINEVGQSAFGSAWNRAIQSYAAKPEFDYGSVNYRVAAGAGKTDDAQSGPIYDTSKAEGIARKINALNDKYKTLTGKSFILQVYGKENVPSPKVDVISKKIEDLNKQYQNLTGKSFIVR